VVDIQYVGSRLYFQLDKIIAIRNAAQTRGVRRTDRQDEGKLDEHGVDVRGCGHVQHVCGYGNNGISAPDPSFHHEICKPEKSSLHEVKSALLRS
jgi:hypothetical protein